MSLSPSPQTAFVDQAVARLSADPRIESVLLAGAPLTGDADAFSDVDLVLICREADYAAVMAERRTIAGSLGPLLAAFTGEHVGEPRVLICLFDAPLLHVDLKFVTRDDLAVRVETPRIVFDRDGTLPAALAAGSAAWPARPPEWFEERFWIWVHYAAAKIARGELFEALDLLAFLRSQVLGPLLARAGGHRQRGVRRVEIESPAEVVALAAVVARHDRADCWRALDAAIDLYRRLRTDRPPANTDAGRERAVLAYLARHRTPAPAAAACASVG